ncbi:MAG: ATPase [Micropepsaceae bacterium]
MRKFYLAALSSALALTLPTVAHAKIVAKSATGFVVEHQLELKTDAKSAYDGFVNIGAWWSSSHSFSGDAKNITIDTKPGGCWCETLPAGGFVKHMDVVHAAPGKMLVFSGGLGPLQFMGVAGSMTVSFQTAKTTNLTTMKLRYDIGGRDDKNFEDISKAVDGVLAEQIARYKNFATGGMP